MMEYEVNKKAVEKYKNYQIYSDSDLDSDWKVVGNEKGGRPFRTSMKGFYLKSEEHKQCVIVGDILTSNKVWNNANRNNPKIESALKCFEALYHIDGNYMPIPEIEGKPSANLRGRNCDTFTHHLNVCKAAIQGTLKGYETWTIWANEIWHQHCRQIDIDCKDDWEEFVREFYFIDFVDNALKPKSFVEGRIGSNQVGIKDENDDIVLETIQKNIDLIIKRDYRIKNKITEKINWDDDKSYKAYKDQLLKERVNLQIM